MGELVEACLSEDPSKRPTALEVQQNKVFSLRALRAAAAERETRAHEEAARAAANHRLCCVCAEEKSVGLGMECGNAAGCHFTCANCLDVLVLEALPPSAHAAWAASNGGIVCPVRLCTGPPFSAANLAKHLPEATYAQLDQARVTLAEHRGGAEAAERLQAEFDERFGELKWVSAGEMLPGGTVCHKISHSDLTTRDTREQREFNFATGQVI